MPLPLEGVFYNVVGAVGLLVLFSTNYLNRKSFISLRRGVRANESHTHTHDIYVGTRIYRFM